jgi:excisionase family DNA binding protein
MGKEKVGLLSTRLARSEAERILNLHSVKEVSKKLGVNEQSVRSWIASGEMRCYNLSNGKGERKFYKVSDQQLEEFLLQKENKGELV